MQTVVEVPRHEQYENILQAAGYDSDIEDDIEQQPLLGSGEYLMGPPEQGVVLSLDYAQNNNSRHYETIGATYTAQTEPEDPQQELKKMYFISTLVYQFVIFVFLLCFVDISKAFSYGDNPLVGPALLTGFAEILLQFAIARDFFIMSILFCNGNSLKFSLTYRFAACLVDLLGVIMVGSYTLALIQNMQTVALPDDGIQDTVVDFLVQDPDFALVFLLLVANNLVQFSLYILFKQLELQSDPELLQQKTNNHEMALLLAAQFRTQNFAQLSAELKDESDKMCCSICLLEFQAVESVTSLDCDPRHIFHEKCLQSSLEYKHACPLCRKPVLAALVTAN